MKPRYQFLRTPQCGVSLVEIMVAMVLGLLLLGGIIQVFLGNQTIARTQQALSEVQENGRYALEVIARDLRHAGFRGGCRTGVQVNSLLDPSGTGFSHDLFDLNTGVRGWNNAPGDFQHHLTGYAANTDVVLVKHAAALTAARPAALVAATEAAIPLSTASGIAQGQILVIADAESCDQFQNSQPANASSVGRGDGSSLSPGNVAPSTVQFGTAYGPMADILRFRSAIYYVGAADAANQTWALRRVRFDNGTPVDEEIAPGLVDLQIRYGIDTGAPPDRMADEYVTAVNVTNWDRVVAVRATMLFSSTEGNVVDAPMSLAFAGTTFNAPDRRMYQVFSTTVGVRNSLP